MTFFISLRFTYRAVNFCSSKLLTFLFNKLPLGRSALFAYLICLSTHLIIPVVMGDNSSLFLWKILPPKNFGVPKYFIVWHQAILRLAFLGTKVLVLPGVLVLPVLLVQYLGTIFPLSMVLWYCFFSTLVLLTGLRKCVSVVL